MKIQVFPQGALQTNSTVLSEKGNCIVVDVPYISWDVEEYVKRNNLHVTAILLTHGHFDHVGGVAHLLKTCCDANTPVYCSRADWQLCNNAESNPFNVTCQNCYPTNDLTEGHYVLDDFSFDVIETAGHTNGSVTYLFGDVMLSGDTLFKGGIGRTDFPESNAAAMQASLAKLAKLPLNYKIICGHDDATDLKREKAFNRYLK